MCGIFGAISLNRELANKAVGIVKNGIGLLKHRGPDDFGIESIGPVCFGHTRLSIIDLESGHQPMQDYAKVGLISYNGEIYNFQVIKEELKKTGYVFNTSSDTEVVLNAYLEWGNNCLKHFRGMFAFVAVDFKKQKVIIARDRLGKKPLFYTIRNDSLFFSSELEPLYKTIGDFKVDFDALDDYLSWQYIHAPRTIYKEVYSLEPAHLLEIDLLTGNMIKKRYWKLHFTEDCSLSIEDWEHKLDCKLRESVKLRLVSDVPFGAFLSGGIDSSLITGYMADILEQPVKTFSIGFNESDFSELNYAKTASQINRTEHHTEIVEVDSFGLLPLLVRHYGQPFADSSSIPTYYVSRMAAKHVKMVFSGDGGDENFAGYNSYEYVMRTLQGDFSNNQSNFTFKQKLRSLGYYYYFRFKRLIVPGNITNHAYELHCHTAKHFSPGERRNLFKKEYRDVVCDIAKNRRNLMNIGHQPMISRLQYLDLMTYLPFDILTKVDIASMANSIEVRAPLLDHEMVETAANMPVEFKLKEEKINNGIEYHKKFILKKIAGCYYPKDFIERPKMGFGIPLGIWFANKLKNNIRKKLLDSEYLPFLFNMKEIASIVDRHSEAHDSSAKLWNLLFLEEWLRSHPDSL
ncbi:MAG: asparagine synthase (glutamine-hydrolyzing) [Candidatus Omnitrophota bacterium]